jgi:hypothetical protein
MNTTPVFEKEIRYDRLTRDYAMYCDGQLVGFAATYHEAELALDQHVLELIQSGITTTASDLDGGDPYAAIGTCHICAAAAWAFGPNDQLLCPSHLAVVQEYVEQTDAVNWSDRPDYADPDEVGEGDGTGLGDRGSEGDDPASPSARLFTDVCPSCGDQLDWQGPGLCAACWEAGKVLPAIRWLRPKHYQRFAVHIGRSHRRRTRRTRKTQLAYLLMRYRTARQSPPVFLRADFAARAGL